MAFDSLIRSGVALANKLTASLQANVTYEAWTGEDGLGGVTYAAPVLLPALVESAQKMRRTSAGEEMMTTHVVTFLYPLAANGALGRREPIDPRDRITLPNGTTGDIVAIEGLMDPTISSNYLNQVWFG